MPNDFTHLIRQFMPLPIRAAASCGNKSLSLASAGVRPCTGANGEMGKLVKTCTMEKGDSRGPGSNMLFLFILDSMSVIDIIHMLCGLRSRHA